MEGNQRRAEAHVEHARQYLLASHRGLRLCWGHYGSQTLKVHFNNFHAEFLGCSFLPTGPLLLSEVDLSWNITVVEKVSNVVDNFRHSVVFCTSDRLPFRFFLLPRLLCASCEHQWMVSDNIGHLHEFSGGVIVGQIA